jgi:5-carboxymethyl-2-hydroxymuconate isomerase
VSLEQLKQEVALLDQAEQAELISYTLQLRYARDTTHRQEVKERLDDTDKAHWLTAEEFERRLDQT